MPPKEESIPAKIGRAAGRAYKRSGLPTTMNKESAASLGWLALIILVGVIGTWAYSALDDAGYLWHTRETSITAQQSWIIGESKICVSVPLQPEEAHALYRLHWDVTNSVVCDSGPGHQIKVTFHGRTERSEDRARWGVSWKCFRRSDSFECYALD